MNQTLALVEIKRLKTLKFFLVGPMGAGKTTLGTLLSKSLEMPYFDNDTELHLTYNFTYEEISLLSVEELHKLETKYFLDVLKRDGPFISGLAASVIDSDTNRDLLLKNYAIYLRLPLHKIIERAGENGVGRQAILGKNRESILIERFNRRDPLYKLVSKQVVQLSSDPEYDAKQIEKYISLICG